MQERLVASERERVLQEKQLEQEERLARELEKLRWESERDERIRQQIKENRCASSSMLGYRMRSNYSATLI